MTVESFSRGNKIYYNDIKDCWCYENTNLPIDRAKAKCIKCGQYPNDNVDACLGRLPGVSYACCGHGMEEGYIVFENGVKIRGWFKIERG